MIATTIAAMALLAAPVQTDEQTVGDLRCIVVSTLLLESPDPATQTTGLMSSFYWLGRLDGHAPNTNLADEIAKQVAAMKPADLAAEAKRCGDIMSVRGRAISAAGQEMQRRAREEAPAARPAPGR